MLTVQVLKDAGFNQSDANSLVNGVVPSTSGSMGGYLLDPDGFERMVRDMAYGRKLTDAELDSMSNGIFPTEMGM